MPLKFTKNQTLILGTLFNNPEKAYYFREIGRMLDKPPGFFQKDIGNLVEDGILESYFQANSRFFKLNKKYPLYKELKSIVFKTIGIEGTLRSELKKLKNIKEAFIYGSFARGQEHKNSDIDLMIIGSPNQDQLMDLINKLEIKFGREVNYTLMSDEEFQKKFKKNLNSFLKNVLQQKRIKLI
ncbi:MAG: polymerase beta domain-containing protein [Candidatus Peregrinibacteria bacterium GW2011_GWC2_39_14]|nr:MAG: polymerase beta domain protein region protein [Candidatus Peregrinibacteria bacterium GW2011_GWA2_38_36]KKR07161.1 MAG: polymerase beta domain-containing protein [Candidatus Peregrinibacteria bacterium GW2011_GWC2_39_14]